MSTDRQYRVFVSHSSLDTWVAKQIAVHVETCGAVPFLDETNLAIGAEFEEEILKFIEMADELLVLITPWALSRPYITAELGAAWGRRLPIIGLLHGLTPTEFQNIPGAPIMLTSRNLISLNQIDRYLAELHARVNVRIENHETESVSRVLQ